jgi:serine/threonine-protein kinase
MQVPDNNPHEVPPRIQGYEILGKLGQGGRSSVWKARQTVLGRMVVIKVLSEQQTHDAEEMRRFKHEALIAASLKHVGIVQVYDFGRLADGIGYYFVMEYVSGYTVGDWLKRKGRLTEAAALTIGSSVADALLYAWSHAMLVHGDLKPDNIMVDGDGTIKITDLGLAQMVNAFVNPARSADAKRPGVGTPNYLAPEQVRGEKNLDCRTDIYGLGTVLYHILTGHLPPSAGIPPGVMDGQIWDSYEDPRKSNSQISSGLAEIIMKMRAQDRAARYQDWKDVMVAIACQEQTAKSGVLVVEPKPSASNDNPSSATIPLRTIAPVTAERKKEPEPEPEEPEDEDEFKPCPYCAEPIRKQAIYCRYCQKDISKKGAAADRRRAANLVPGWHRAVSLAQGRRRPANFAQARRRAANRSRDEFTPVGGGECQAPAADLAPYSNGDVPVAPRGGMLCHLPAIRQPGRCHGAVSREAAGVYAKVAEYGGRDGRVRQ